MQQYLRTRRIGHAQHGAILSKAAKNGAALGIEKPTNQLGHPGRVPLRQKLGVLPLALGDLLLDHIQHHEDFPFLSRRFTAFGSDKCSARKPSASW